jgi:hypothetical protein
MNTRCVKAAGGELTLQEQREEGNEEDQKNGYDAAFDPVKNRCEDIACRCIRQDVAIRVRWTNIELLVKSSNV